MTEQQELMLMEARDNSRESLQILKSNPDGGLVLKVERILVNMITKNECEKIRNDTDKVKKGIWNATRNILWVVLTVGAVTAAFLKVFL